MSQAESFGKQRPRCRLRGYHFIWEAQALGCEGERRGKEVESGGQSKAPWAHRGLRLQREPRRSKCAQATRSPTGTTRGFREGAVLSEPTGKEGRRDLPASVAFIIHVPSDKISPLGANALNLWPLGEWEARAPLLGPNVAFKSPKEATWCGWGAEQDRKEAVARVLRGAQGSSPGTVRIGHGDTSRRPAPGQGGVSKASQIPAAGGPPIPSNGREQGQGHRNERGSHK